MFRVNSLAFSDVQTAASLVGTSVTALAVVVGGGWAYFKFLRGRTFRPRLSVQMDAQWQLINDRPLLHARITVKNIGASVVTLRQFGTGLRVSTLAAHQPEPPTSAQWEIVRVFEILTDHEWIEAGETVSDDQLLDIGAAEPTPVLFEARLVWSWSGNKKEIVVMAREIFLPETSITTPSAATVEQS